MKLGLATRTGENPEQRRRRIIGQAIFIFLQFMDLCTTMVAIHAGGVEKNFLVARFLFLGTLQGLILSKVLVLAIANVVVFARKDRVLGRANLAFGIIVLWNCSVILRLALRARGI
jgi:hypothetical protein